MGNIRVMVQVNTTEGVPTRAVTVRGSMDTVVTLVSLKNNY